MLSQRLRHRVDIQDVTHPQNPETGAFSEVWATILSSEEVEDGVPAEIVDLSGRELLAAAAEQADITTRIVMRYRPDVRARMRIVHDGLAYNIRSVVTDAKRAVQLTLMCTSGVNQG